MVMLVATKAQRFSGRKLKAGDSFSASRRDAKILTALHRARLDCGEAVAGEAAPPAPVVKPVVEPPAIAPEVQEQPADDLVGDAAPVEISARTGLPKRTYRRRNLTAE